MTEIDIPVRPHRKTLQQTAIILNVSTKTVRRYLDEGKLEWSGSQVLLKSIIAYLGNSKDEEAPAAEVEKKTASQQIKMPKISRPSSGWVKRW